MKRTWTVNNEKRTVEFEPLSRLLDVLRGELGILSPKEGCGEGECGTCSVVINNELHLACLTTAAQVEEGAEILTAEGLASISLGKTIKRYFDEQGAIQCGYCSPGMLLGSYALLRNNPRPSKEEIRKALSGHICRCTGYSSIVNAVDAAAKEFRK
ncbi:MAG: (2Fe-2S)-binding protein [Pseudomonadota bacterium]